MGTLSYTTAVSLDQGRAEISSKHVGSTGSHADASATLWLDGAATNPAR